MKAYRWYAPLPRKCFGGIQQSAREAATLEFWMDRKKSEIGRAHDPGFTTRRTCRIEGDGSNNAAIDFGN